MKRSELARRHFTIDDQLNFATLTGDWNPMHVDALYARRTQAGDTVIHGIHALLWALEELAQQGYLEQPIATVDAQFWRFLYLNTDVVLRVRQADAAAVRVELVDNEAVTTVIAVGFGASAPAQSRQEPSVCRPLPTAPVVATFEGGDTDVGAFALVQPSVAPLFRHLVSRLGVTRVEAIAASSPLVGMMCPGLHSIFSTISVRCVNLLPSQTGLSYRVSERDERFRLLTVAFDASGVEGTIAAFVRWPPVDQPSLAELRRIFAHDAFAGTTALVVGGSRGLGALTARAIVAGGGRVIITYAVGEAEAHSLAGELGADACRVVRYDARATDDAPLRALPWPIDRLYYYASTHIYRQKHDWYVAERFREMCDVYVDGFDRVCRAVQPRNGPPLLAFYPSTVAIDDRPRDMTEYAMAKAAGELLCADMNRFARAIRVHVERLPRILTDQTASVIPVESADALEVVVRIMRVMHAGLRAPEPPPKYAPAAAGPQP